MQETVMKTTRRQVLGAAGASALAAGLAPSLAQAQTGPIKIGMSMPLTGGLGGFGQTALLSLRMWARRSMPRADCWVARSS
jgi:ABC-type branched-subunit amino acid transport system substrate-binding protein